MKKSNLKPLLRIKKRFHIYAIECNLQQDVAPVKAKINGIDIEFSDLGALSFLQYWKDSKSAFANLLAAIKEAYDKAE